MSSFFGILAPGIGLLIVLNVFALNLIFSDGQYIYGGILVIFIIAFIYELSQQLKGSKK